MYAASEEATTTMDASQDTHIAGTTVCPSCGQSIGPDTQFCPTCGRPRAGVDWDQPTVQDPPAIGAPVPAPVAASAVSWQVYPEAPTDPAGISALGAGPAIAAAPPVKSHRLRNVLAVVSSICLVALLAGTSFWLYTAFAARSETAAARFVPANSVAFVSVDLNALNSNSHHFSIQDLAASGGGSPLQNTGLDLQKDVLPWIGQYASFAVFPQSTTTTNGMPAVGAVALLQSRDDNATAAALKKALDYQRSHGTSVNQSQFGGFTLYTSGQSGNNGAVLTSGKGWAIFASDQQAAQAVINRINGQGDTLDSAQAFKDAIGSLPSGRFGTIYVNLRQIVNAILPSGAPNGAASMSIPFLDTYPTGAGSLEWTDAGLRGQMTFSAVHGTTIANVAGDTTSLAQLVPSTAVGYQGVANAGNLVRTYITQFLPAAVSGQDPLKSGLGVSYNDPALQQPGAIALLKSGSTVHPLFLLHAPDAKAAQALLQNVAQQQKWTLQPTKVAGQDATAIYGSAPEKPNTATATTTATDQQLIGVATVSQGTLIVAQTTDDLSTVLTVAAGNQASLAKSASFAKLQQQAGTSAAAASYLDAQSIEALMHTGTSTATLPVKFLYSTMQWTNSALQTTSNITLSN
jgi:Protein of unknown function (DUF3352)